MLLEFTCSNHKSIRSKVLFSVLAGKDNTYEDKMIEVSGIRVLKSAVIYGAKTNSINHQPGQGIRQTPHKLDGFERESSYKIQFIAQGIRYVLDFR